jgi:hypothetical protein
MASLPNPRENPDLMRSWNISNPFPWEMSAVPLTPFIDVVLKETPCVPLMRAVRVGGYRLHEDGKKIVQQDFVWVSGGGQVRGVDAVVAPAVAGQ